jgi:hypothetical protein
MASAFRRVPRVREGTPTSGDGRASVRTANPTHSRVLATSANDNADVQSQPVHCHQGKIREPLLGVRAVPRPGVPGPPEREV